MGGCCSGGAGGAAAKKEASTTTYSGDKTTSSVQISPILSGSKSGSVESQRHSLLSVLVPREFSYKEITAATHRFAKDRIIGHGGSGTVYRGTVDGGGGTVEIPVAVKAITADSARAMKEYLSEIAIISSIRHRHLVKLYGWCHEGGLFLVYEYFRNGSLEQFLHGGGNKYRELPWSRRFEILKGVGSALQYLHNECDRAIIHRDVKSSNVLLDENYMAKLGDFGLSRQIGHGESGVQTMVVAGTEGYVAPEVFLTETKTLIFAIATDSRSFWDGSRIFITKVGFLTVSILDSTKQVSMKSRLPWRCSSPSPALERIPNLDSQSRRPLTSWAKSNPWRPCSPWAAVKEDSLLPGGEVNGRRSTPNLTHSSIHFHHVFTITTTTTLSISIFTITSSFLPSIPLYHYISHSNYIS